MRRAFMIFATAAGLGAAACTEETPTDPGPPVPDFVLDGLWDFTETFARPNGSFMCADTGTVDFTASGRRSDQTGTCTSPAGRYYNLGPIDVSPPSVRGDTISFRTSGGGCLYESVASGPAATELSGSVACFDATGTFTMKQASPVASVDVVFGADSLVVGGAVGALAQVRNAAGERLFFRPVTWSSDAVATVDAVSPVAPNASLPLIHAGENRANVVAFGTGAATISATVGAVSGSAQIASSEIELSTVSMGLDAACGLSPAGAAYCWGANGVYGALGFERDVTPTCSDDPVDPVSGANWIGYCAPAPTLIHSGVAFADLAVSGAVTCGLDAAGAASCWGLEGVCSDFLDPLCIDGASPEPRTVAGGHTFTRIFGAPSGIRICGLTAAGDAYCWTYFDAITAEVPGLVPGGVNFTTLVMGADHTCGLDTSGAAHCWGISGPGALGDSTTADSPNPVTVHGGHAFTKLSAGSHHACGISGATTYCWGLNSSRQLGDGTSVNSTFPVAVVGAPTLEAIAVGDDFSCGLDAGGDLYCWGATFGQSDQPPTLVGGGLHFSEVVAGSYTVCGLASDGWYCSAVDPTRPLAVGGGVNPTIVGAMTRVGGQS